MLNHHHMMAAYRHHAGTGRGWRKAEPISREIQARDDAAEYPEARPAPTIGVGATRRAPGDNSRSTRTMMVVIGLDCLIEMPMMAMVLGCGGR